VRIHLAAIRGGDKLHPARATHAKPSALTRARNTRASGRLMTRADVECATT